MAVNKVLQVLLLALSLGVGVSSLNIAAFNIEIFGVSKMKHPDVVQILVKVSSGFRTVKSCPIIVMTNNRRHCLFPLRVVLLWILIDTRGLRSITL